ncbi:ulp1 protease family, C-terminal catalytic domain-containing protein [Tanacetum coccineum]
MPKDEGGRSVVHVLCPWMCVCLDMVSSLCEDGLCFWVDLMFSFGDGLGTRERLEILAAMAAIVSSSGGLSFLGGMVYNAKVSIRSKLEILQTIRSKLSWKEDRLDIFSRTVFGPWLNIQTTLHDNHLLNFLLQHQRFISKPSTNQPFIFDIDGRTLEYGREDFCLITGFRFGKVNLDPDEEDHSEFRMRVFPKIENLKGEHLLELVNKDVKFAKLDDEDVVRVCLLLALDFVFMGHELRHVVSKPIVNLVDDFYKWDAFPWGEYMWSFFHKRDYNVAVSRRTFHLEKLASNPKYEANYVLYGFVFPLKVKTFSNSIHWWRKDENLIPHGVAWSNGLKFKKSNYDRFFYSKNSTVNKLFPSAIEMNELWWRSSLDYFKKVTHSIPVLRSATKGSSKGKSFHTRVRTEVRHEVHVRTEVSRVHSKEEVHVPAVEIKDIQERGELLKTVQEQKQMIIDLQVCLNSVEEKLKPGPSDVDHLDKIGNLSKNAPDCGLDQQSMGGVSQCMNVDEPYKNWNDVSDNFHVDGLDHKSVEGVSQCTGLNDEYESVAVDGLISLRSRDVGHLSKKSFVFDSPQFKVKDNEEACHSDFSLSTQQVQDACVSELLDVVKDDVNKRLKKVIKTIVGSDGVEIKLLPWKEDVTHSPTAPKRTVTVPEEVNALFRDKNRMELVGRSHTKRGWISTFHLDFWIDYLWQFREPNADWAIASPYLCDMLSRFQYPLYYADGVKYGVPWFANNVQKVYFPINKKDPHWVLEELHISSGLITIYDSLGCPHNVIETCLFWLDLREKLQFQIPLFLDNVEVFEKKNIVKDDYSISF